MSAISAKTIINAAVNRPLLQCFCYRLDGNYDQSIIGCRVKIPFGKGSTIGIIESLAKAGTMPEAQLKTAQLIDRKPVLSPDVMQMLRFGASYYHFPLGQSLMMALPKLLREGRSTETCSIQAVSINPKANLSAVKTQAVKQKQVLQWLSESGPLALSKLKERGISSAVIQALLKKDLIQQLELKPQSRNWRQETVIEQEKPPMLNAQQQVAADAVLAAHGFAVFLLNGITGSGKTEVYLQVIAKTLQHGRSALVLVPEISLTPQTFERFYRRFKVPVASMHSALSDKERLNAWLEIQQGRAGILIGTRSALFTPMPKLGLIVIDEEHDPSFRQNDGLRYHARDLAIVRARAAQCPVLLGSATPSLESVLNCQQQRYQRLDLTQRAGGASLPQIKLIDLRGQTLSEGLKTGIGSELEEAIGEQTVMGNQVLLFLNRRGYSHHLMCADCGRVIICPHCDNPLTVHRAKHALCCHICEYQRPIPKTCDHCGSEALIETGFGTEQVEEFLKLRYPDLGIERIDRDSISSKKDLNESLQRIRQGNCRILLGTQMLAKGHDFPDVTLVGILDIDAGLCSDDFRSQEYTAQLITQVAGRAGRAKKRGTVMLQTFAPDHPLIQALINPALRYWDIALMLLRQRRQLNLPPYSSQAYCLANSPDREAAYDFLLQLYEQLQTVLEIYPDLEVRLPDADKIEKRANRYYFHLLINAPSRRRLQEFLNSPVITQASRRAAHQVRFSIEVDPQLMY